MEKGSQEITSRSTWYADHRFQRREEPDTGCFSIWTEGRKWSKYGINGGRVAFSLFFPLATKGPRGIRFTGHEKRGKCSYCVALRIEIVFLREERDRFQRKIEREDGGMLESNRNGPWSVKRVRRVWIEVSW